MKNKTLQLVENPDSDSAELILVVRWDNLLRMFAEKSLDFEADS